MTRLIKVPARPLSRRTFLQTTAVAGAAAAGLGTGLLPGTARAAPTRGGTLRVAKGHGSTTDTLDPGTWEHGYVIAMGYGIHGYLTGIAKDGSVEPQLAESWEASDDATVWRFNLRSGVTYHSGRAVTAEDVVVSINHHRREDTTSVAAPLVAEIVDLATDGDTVIMTLAAGNADLPFLFTDYHIPVCPANDDGTMEWQAGDGCGPYRLLDFQPGISTTLERNTNDWDQNRGWFERIELLSIIDANARTTALVSGDVMAIDRVDLKTAGLMGRNPGVTINSVAGNQHYTFPMNSTMSPYDNNHVRQALKYAVNRQEMVDKILFGYGSLGNDHPIGQGQRFFNTDLAQTEYDPDRAQFHLREAGLDGLSVSLSAADAAFAGAVDAAVLYQASAEGAGIALDVNRVPNDGYWADVWMQDPWSASYWGGRPTEDAMFTTAYVSGADWNESFWSNERFDELLLAARAELDEAKRREMYFEMQAILNQDGGSVIPMFANYVFATNEGLATGDQFSSHWDMDGERWMERWYMA